MAGPDGSAALPVIDVGPLIGPASAGARAGVAGKIQAACRERGFFYVTGHRLPAGLLDQLADASAEFFAAGRPGGGSSRSVPSSPPGGRI